MTTNSDPPYYYAPPPQYYYPPPPRYYQPGPSFNLTIPLGDKDWLASWGAWPGPQQRGRDRSPAPSPVRSLNDNPPVLLHLFQGIDHFRQ